VPHTVEIVANQMVDGQRMRCLGVQRGNEMEALVRFVDDETVMVQSQSESEDGSTAAMSAVS